MCLYHHSLYIDGLVQERRNCIANALELRLYCTNPSIWPGGGGGCWNPRGGIPEYVRWYRYKLISSIIAADGLATERARASEDIVLTLFFSEYDFKSMGVIMVPRQQRTPPVYTYSIGLCCLVIRLYLCMLVSLIINADTDFYLKLFTFYTHMLCILHTYIYFLSMLFYTALLFCEPYIVVIDSRYIAVQYNTRTHQPQ